MKPLSSAHPSNVLRKNQRIQIGYDILSKIRNLVLLTTATCVFFTPSASATNEESLNETPCIINGKFGIKFSNYSKNMSETMMTWHEYTEERRFYKLLQVQLSYASEVANRLSGMEAIFSQVTEEELRLNAMRQMHLHYKDAYLALETYWDGTEQILAMRSDLATSTSKEVQELIAPYAIQWIQERSRTFEAELRRIDPEFKD